MPRDSADVHSADLDEAARKAPDGGQAPNEVAPDPPASDPPAQDWEDRARRAAADLDNLRKRHARELEQAGAAERAEVAAGWLPVIDNLELALAHADADPATIVEGIRAVRDQAVSILARLGYERHDELGVPFDPTQHEVLSVLDEPEVPPGTVVQVLRPGYGDADRQLRPVAVAVSRKPE
ncbi:MAG: putative GrpE heat shock protein [Jatrophihabitans sp.]|nr:putative GrpE heat shock protein [Jatrophihabitans sp.]